MLQYLVATLFLFQLCMVLYNLYAFLLRRRRRLQNVSILGFYLLTIILTVLRFYYAIWFFYERENQYVTPLLMVPILKINMGFIGCWMLFELSLFIDHSYNLSKWEDKTFDE